MPVLSPAGSPCLVYGNLGSMSGGQIPQGKVIFQLANFGSGLLPRILSSFIFPKTKYVLESAPNGVFSGYVWGNDQIDPANTIYQVTFQDSLGNEIGPFNFYINGVNFNLDMATPLSILSFPIYTSLGFATGTPLGLGNFALSGWGTGAAITGITGTQMGFILTITAGSGASVGPTVVLTYPAPFPNPPMVIASQTGGTGAVSDVAVASGTTSTTYTYKGLPLNGSTYIITSFTLGL